MLEWNQTETFIMRASLLLILGSIMLAASARGQEVTTVGIPTESFDYVASMQEASDWCWAASTQMVLKWFGVEVSQDDVVRRTKGRVVDQSASVRDITAALNGIRKTSSGSEKVIHTVNFSGPPHPLVIIKQLSLHVPMLLTIDTGPRSGHVVVLTAARYYNTDAGPHISSLIVRDPYPSPYNLQNQGRVEISGRDLNNFVRQIDRTWMVWVTDGRRATSKPRSVNRR